jgi:hypothetical protein
MVDQGGCPSAERVEWKVAVRILRLVALGDKAVSTSRRFFESQLGALSLFALYQRDSLLSSKAYSAIKKCAIFVARQWSVEGQTGARIEDIQEAIYEGKSMERQVRLERVC